MFGLHPVSAQMILAEGLEIRIGSLNVLLRGTSGTFK